MKANLENELYWLAGIIDGEGSVMIEKQQQHYISYHQKITISNTSNLIICCIKRILKKIGITYYCLKCKSQRKDGYKRVPCYDLQIHRVKEVLKLAVLLRDKLILKNQRINLIIKFCQLRINKRKKVSKNAFAGFDNREENLFQKLRKLNKRGVIR